MEDFIQWLSRRRVFTGILILAYGAALILGHGGASKVADWITVTLTRPVFGRIITGSLVAILLLFAVLIRINYRRFRDHSPGIPFAVATLLLVAAAYNTLLVTNVESIHFFQYALLALPVFALTRRFGATVLWVTLLGAIDETYQYLWLYRQLDIVYLDFNDIVLDALGAGIGVTAIYLWPGSRLAAAPPAAPSPVPRFALLLLPTGLGLCLFLAVAAGLVELYPAAGGAGSALPLSRAPEPAAFWVHFQGWGKSYHVLHPLEGWLLIQGLILFYGVLDRGRSGKPQIREP